MKIGDIFTFQIYSSIEKVRLIAIHPFGTIDIERLSDGRCFRVTGLRPWK